MRSAQCDEGNLNSTTTTTKSRKALLFKNDDGDAFYSQKNLSLRSNPNRRAFEMSETRVPLTTDGICTSPTLSDTTSNNDDATCAVSDASEEIIHVVDPASRKLEIPLALLQETLVFHRVGTPSLCMLFLKGHCRMGAKCHQAHVDAKVVEILRAQVRSTPTCCRMHGDLHSKKLTLQMEGYHVSLAGQRIDPQHLAKTIGLQQLIEEVAATLPHSSTSTSTRSSDAVCASEHSKSEEDVKKTESKHHSGVITLLPRHVCRLHIAGKCRFVEECNHIHICRDFPGISEIARRGEGKHHPTSRKKIKTVIPPQGREDPNRSHTLKEQPNCRTRCAGADPIPIGSLLDLKTRGAQDWCWASHYLFVDSMKRHNYAKMECVAQETVPPTQRIEFAHNPYNFRVLTEYWYVSHSAVARMIPVQFTCGEHQLSTSTSETPVC